MYFESARCDHLGLDGIGEEEDHERSIHLVILIIKGVFSTITVAILTGGTKGDQNQLEKRWLHVQYV